MHSCHQFCSFIISQRSTPRDRWSIFGIAHDLLACSIQKHILHKTAAAAAADDDHDHDHDHDHDATTTVASVCVAGWWLAGWPGG